MPHHSKTRTRGAPQPRKQTPVQPSVAAIESTDTDADAAAEAKPDGELREHMVAEAAYYRALNRGFDGGDPNEDWYLAEREIDERLPTVH